MAEPIVVVGAGGFGREILDVIDAINTAAESPVWKVTGVVDDEPAESNLQRLAARGITYLGPIHTYLSARRRDAYTVGIGAPGIRRVVSERFDSAGRAAAVLIHPTATRGFGVDVGGGSVICAGVRLTTNIRLGRHVHLNLNATIGHDTIIGDYVSANPLASISGDCVIEDDVLVGVGGVVLNGLVVGRGATVGGSACVVKDVPAGAVVKGVPAR